MSLVVLVEIVGRAGLAEVVMPACIAEHRGGHRPDRMEAEGIPLDRNVCPARGWACGVCRGAGLAGLSVVAMHLVGGDGLGAEALLASEAVEYAPVVVVVCDRDAEHLRDMCDMCASWEFKVRLEVSGTGVGRGEIEEGGEMPSGS